MSVWEKENEKERARDEESKIKAKRTHCGQWRKSSRKLKTRWEVWVSGDGDMCVEKKKQEKQRKEKEKKRMDARKESKNNKKKKNHN